jgi:hypothetical protein
MLVRLLGLVCLISFATLNQGPPAAKIMGPEEMAEFFRAGAGLIAPLGQTIHRYEAAISF